MPLISNSAPPTRCSLSVNVSDLEAVATVLHTGELAGLTCEAPDPDALMRGAHRIGKALGAKSAVITLGPRFEVLYEFERGTRLHACLLDPVYQALLCALTVLDKITLTKESAMRISIERDDPGFVQDPSGYHITFNSRPSPNCLMADDEKHEIKIIKTDEAGRAIMNEQTGEFEIETKIGHVVITKVVGPG